MKRFLIISLVTVFLLIAAGCQEQPASPTQASTSTVSTTPLATTTPVPTETDPPQTTPTQPPATTPEPTTTPPQTTIPPETTPPAPTEPVIPIQWHSNTGSYINFRAKPDGPILLRVQENDSVELLGWDELFAHVKYGNQEGYVAADLIMPTDENWFSEYLDIVPVTNKYSYEQMIADMNTLLQQYPQLVALDSIGASEEGRNIPVMRIGSPDAQYHILLQGAIHGREHMTAWLLMAMADYWLDHDLLSYGDVCYHIIPMSNPDGVMISQTSTLNSFQQDIYNRDKRKGYTTHGYSHYARLWKANAMGVDINRNFPSGWDNLHGYYYPSAMLFRGKEPFSSAEAAALRDYTLSYPFDLTISYHAAGSVIYYRYGKNEEINAQSKALAYTIAAFSGYTPKTGAELDGGGYKDWAIDQLSIPSLTIEIGCGEAPLLLRETHGTFVRNLRVLPTLAQWVQQQPEKE